MSKSNGKSLIVVESKRNCTIDLLRCFAVVTVVFGHCIQYGSGKTFAETNQFFDNIIFKYIYSFHMPLFAAISGYLFYSTVNKYSLKKIIINRISRIFIPILSWHIILTLFDAAKKIVKGFISKSGGVDRHTVSEILIELVSIHHNMWFLWSMLILSCGVIAVHYLFKDNIVIYIVGFFATLLMPDQFRMFLWLYPFFVGAYITAQNTEQLKDVFNRSKKPMPLIIIFTFHLITVIFWKSEYYIYNGTTTLFGQIDYIKYAAALAYRIVSGTFGILAYTAAISIVANKNSEIANNRIVLYCSKYSLGIYVLGSYIISPCMLQIPFAGFNIVLTLIQTVIMLAVSISAMIFVDRIPIFRKAFLGGR